MGIGKNLSRLLLIEGGHIDERTRVVVHGEEIAGTQSEAGIGVKFPYSIQIRHDFD